MTLRVETGYLAIPQLDSDIRILADTHSNHMIDIHSICIAVNCSLWGNP